MTPEQHAELNAWIAENVFQAKNIVWIECWAELGNPTRPFSNHGADLIPNYTTSPADAMAVLEVCLKETEHAECIYMGYMHGGGFLVGHEQLHIEAEAETLPLAICLFAKALFSEEKR